MYSSFGPIVLVCFSVDEAAMTKAMDFFNSFKDKEKLIFIL